MCGWQGVDKVFKKAKVEGDMMDTDGFFRCGAMCERRCVVDDEVDV